MLGITESPETHPVYSDRLLLGCFSGLQPRSRFYSASSPAVRVGLWVLLAVQNLQSNHIGTYVR